jgi:hypothetical protein
MAIYKHPDGSYHRYPPNSIPAAPKLHPIPGCPNWYRSDHGPDVYVEPPRPTPVPPPA